MSEKLLRFFPESGEIEKKPPFQCSLHMGRHAVNIFSELDHFLPYFEGLGHDYITSFPGWGIEKTPTDSEYSIVYYPQSTSGFHYDREKRTLFAFGKPEDYENGQADPDRIGVLIPSEITKKGLIYRPFLIM